MQKTKTPKLEIRTLGLLLEDLELRLPQKEADGYPPTSITFRGGDGVDFDEVLISYYCNITEAVAPYYSEPRQSNKDSFGGSFKGIVFRDCTDIYFDYDHIIGGHYIARVTNESLPEEVIKAIIHIPTWKEKQEAEEESCS